MRLRMSLVTRWSFDLMLRLSAQGAILMLRISSDWRDRSMKCVSIFCGAARRRFSARERQQMNSSRDEFWLVRRSFRRRMNAASIHIVIASAAKQSRLSPREHRWIASLRSQ
jgi:hypothetical protein